MEDPIKMDDLGVPLFLETPISLNSLLSFEKTQQSPLVPHYLFGIIQAA